MAGDVQEELVMAIGAGRRIRIEVHVCPDIIKKPGILGAISVGRVWVAPILTDPLYCETAPCEPRINQLCISCRATGDTTAQKRLLIAAIDNQGPHETTSHLLRCRSALR